MEALGYGCALVLAAVFVWAGAAKLVRPAETAGGFGALGLPWAEALARLVPVLELLLAVALVAVPPIGGIAALVLLVAFSAVLIRALRAGVTTGCACFGTAAGRRLSPRDLARNAVLAALAIAALMA
jgi:uncharacterized membrane protein YphA (DoxX/SURF4 family)